VRLADVSPGNGLGRVFRLLRSIVRRDEEVGGEFCDVEDVSDSILLAELNNLHSIWGGAMPVEPR